MVKRLQGQYRAAVYQGKNESGVAPLGKKVLVLMDEFEGTFAGGELEFLPEVVERMDLASESGVLIDLGGEAFSSHPDGTRWNGRKPSPGEHLYAEKYAGLLVMGNDGKKYRLMDDSCVGAIYTVEAEGDDNG